MKTLDQCRVLVVDDMVENLWMAADILQGVCLVTTLDNGGKTVETARQCRPDLILLDIVMPGSDGFSVCKALKENPQTKSIPVIFLTSLGDAENRIEAFEAGGVDYILKPFFAGELKARIRTHLQFSLMEEELRNHVDYLSHALESAEENYLFLARNTSDILLQLNASCEISRISPAWTELTGVATEAVTGLPFEEIPLPEDTPGVATAISEALANRAGEAQLSFRIPGRVTPVSVRGTFRLLYDTEGNFLNATVVLTPASPS